MTTSSAPIPAGTVIDISPGGASAPLPAAPVVQEAVVYTGKITVGRYEWQLVTKLSAADMVAIQEAQDSRQLRRLLDVMPRVVVQSQREQLLAYVWAEEHENEADIVGLDEAFEALGEALEQINNRPTNK